MSIPGAPPLASRYQSKGTEMLAEYIAALYRQSLPQSPHPLWKVEGHWFPDCDVEWSRDQHTRFFQSHMPVVDDKVWLDGTWIRMYFTDPMAVVIYMPLPDSFHDPLVLTIANPTESWVEGVIHRFISQLARSTHVSPPWG